MTVFSTRYFYSRPRVGATNPETHRQTRWGSYFYSRPREGGDKDTTIKGGQIGQFLLTPPRGGRQPRRFVVHLAALFLLTPRKEGDLTGGGAAPRQRDFYSRPRMGGDISA